MLWLGTESEAEAKKYLTFCDHSHNGVDADVILLTRSSRYDLRVLVPLVIRCLRPSPTTCLSFSLVARQQVDLLPSQSKKCAVTPAALHLY